MSGGGRVGADLARLSAMRADIAAIFAAAGAARVELDTLQPADVMLDLYGEDIRARAYLVQDPVAGELFLRPDFTVPVARLHMEQGLSPARYSYDGLVWRRQEPEANRPTEYLQAGIELIGGLDPAAEEAEVFSLIRSALGDLADSVVTGDLGVIFAAIDALGTSEPRKAALRRHVWRPKRFHALLDRYASNEAPETARLQLLSASTAERRKAIAAAGKFVGMRGDDEILARLDTLDAEAAEPPLPAADRAMIEAVLAVREPSDQALARLRTICPRSMAPALGRMERRLDALAGKGVDPAILPFDAAFGRSLEYYDGFVFEFRSAHPALPPLGGGGRYDALTASLAGGAGASAVGGPGSSAVGGVVRPEAMNAAEALGGAGQ